MAKNDCWLIGDSLLNDSYRYLREMSTNTHLLQLPYLCRFYDVNVFTKSPLCPDSVITHLRNSVMQDINEMDRLPKRIVLCIYLTLNLVLPRHPSGRNSYPSGRKMLQHAMDFVRSEQLYQSWPQDKYRLIPLASVQLSIKLILSLSLVS